MPQKYITALAAAICLFLTFSAASAKLDKSKYITIDEISAGDDAYCLTVYKGVEIEKFPLKVLDVVRNFRPGRNAILVIGTDERFVHTGPVAGCSGSPVYINGRLAGALAFGWSFAKDALYGVTPIAEMLEVGKNSTAYNNKQAITCCVDFSKPISLQSAYEKLTASAKEKKQQNSAMGLNYLTIPLTSSLPVEILSDFSDTFRAVDMVPVAAGSSGASAKYKDIALQPGGILATPLVYGDIQLAAIGTVTDIVGDKVYGFGHSFMGQGQFDVPMATGYVHTVVANIISSFKFGRFIDIKGALFADESTAVVGQLGKQAKIIPMKINIEHFDKRQCKSYDCKMANHSYFTPLLAAVCVNASAKAYSSLPDEHSVAYDMKINIANAEDIHIKNFSSQNDVFDCISDTAGAMNLLLNNPYHRCTIENLDFNVKILDQTKLSHIWSAAISETTAKPGDTVKITVVLETYLGGNKTYTNKLKIPSDIEVGTYNILIGGTNDYMQFIRNAAAYKYTPEDLPSMIRIINDIASVPRKNVYILMPLSADGIAIESSPLVDLPQSKAMLLSNARRSLKTVNTIKWLEQTIDTDTIVSDSRVLNITIEK